jgi:citrate synthase
LSSQEAAAFLGIKVETLYAYASRGLVKGLPGPRGGGRRYRREDLEPLRARSAGPAAQALRFGEPVLDTRITRMTAQGPQYCGHLATELASGDVPFEAVAELLWSGALPAGPVRWPHDAPAPPWRELARLLPAGSSPLSALAITLPVLAAADPMRFDTEPASVMARARRLIPQLAACCALVLDTKRLAAASDTGDPVRALALALGVPVGRKTLDLLRCALILSADHELNTSTFAARACLLLSVRSAGRCTGLPASWWSCWCARPVAPTAPPPQWANACAAVRSCRGSGIGCIQGAMHGCRCCSSARCRTSHARRVCARWWR